MRLKHSTPNTLVNLRLIEPNLHRLHYRLHANYGYTNWEKNKPSLIITMIISNIIIITIMIIIMKELETKQVNTVNKCRPNGGVSSSTRCKERFRRELGTTELDKKVQNKTVNN